MNLALRSLIFLVVGAASFGTLAASQEITFADRVRAQEAIERVYYEHQIGSSRPFEEAVPRSVLEAKVRTYLRQSVALETFWNTPVTAEVLRAELVRIAANSRFPERLQEIYAALGNDPALVLECFVRPVLVDRLSRNFFAFDGRVHGQARAQAEGLHAGLLHGRIDPSANHLARSLVRFVLRDAASSPVVTAEDSQQLPREESQLRSVQLEEGEFRQERNRAPEQPGLVGDVVESRDAFSSSIVLSEDTEGFTVASYTVTKIPWEEWWSSVGERFDDQQVRSIDLTGEDLPAPRPPDEAETWSASGNSCSNEGVWQNRSLMDVPDRRVLHTAVWTGSLMIVWGGQSGGTFGVDTGGRYDPLTDTWTPTSRAGAPKRRAGHSAVWTGSFMIVWGGNYYDTAIEYLDSGGRYDPATDTWAPISNLGAPSPRNVHTAVWTGSLMIVWGGAAGGSTYLNTGGRYDPVADQWAATSALGAPLERSGHTAVWIGSVMVVWGGSNSGSLNLDSGGRYDPVLDTWAATSTTNAPSARRYHSAVWTGSRVIIWGGSASGGSTPTGGQYDPVGDTWTPTSLTNTPSGRHFHTAVWTGSVMVVWGGYEAAYPHQSSTGARYDPFTDSWTPTSTTNAPDPRQRPSAVWTGELMVVWGGRTNSGGRYDPVSDTWTATSTGIAPSSRYGHTAVWTGNLMIVWGGVRGSGLLGTGGRYDPVTDVWTPVSMVNAPEARARHVAAWTGSLMVVWGGIAPSGPPGGSVSSGGRYDPITDSWTDTSMIGAPAGRTSGTAVWDGTRMIIWGGVVFSGNDNTGGRYDPVTDTWTPTSTVGAPSRRGFHTAVWTGSRMIVWGGYGSSFLGTGGRYDPVTDTWEPISTIDAPSERYWHTAVWTGSRMIVWGGESSDTNSPYLDTGGRYDPLTDSWMPTSLVNAPLARYGHTAVWAGSRMVIWGGRFEDSGGVYDPGADSWMPTSLTDAPLGRLAHTAVWTGSLMIVWGGWSEDALGSGGCYALGQDFDGDGFIDCDDCDDADPSVNPLATELPGNSVDENCDGATVCDPQDDWRNHGLFMRCVVQACQDLVRSGAVGSSDCQDLLLDAARSGTERRVLRRDR